MSEDLPLLQKLSNEAMKPRHWREVFTGMGESYEAGWTFTVEEILAYRPSLYADIIAKVPSVVQHVCILQQACDVCLKLNGTKIWRMNENLDAYAFPGTSKMVCQSWSHKNNKLAQ